jgi:hypothetical protein
LKRQKQLRLKISTSTYLLYRCQHEAKIVIFNYYYYYYYYYDLSKIAVLPEGRDEISQFFAKFPPENFQKQKKKKQLQEPSKLTF